MDLQRYFVRTDGNQQTFEELFNEYLSLGNDRDRTACRYASIALAAEMTSVKPHDHLGLTNNQQQTIYQDLGKQGEKATVPASFKAAIGETVPNSVKLRMIPADVAKRVPAVKSYDFAALRNKVLIVDRSNKRIVDIINRS
jgi:Protein of unknown function (DUF1236)